jgi:ATP-dependent DNA ligase
MAAGVRTDPCIPTLAAKPPADSDWVHEIGCRLIARRKGKAVQLFTRRGYDWTELRIETPRAGGVQKEPASR